MVRQHFLDTGRLTAPADEDGVMEAGREVRWGAVARIREAQRYPEWEEMRKDGLLSRRPAKSWGLGSSDCPTK